MTSLILMLSILSNEPNLSCNVVYTFEYKSYEYLAMRINTRCEDKSLVRVNMSEELVGFGDSVCKFAENENGLFLVCVRERENGQIEKTEVSIPDCKYNEQDLYLIMKESKEYRHIFVVKCFKDIQV